MGELIGIATASKDGLLSAKMYRRSMQVNKFSNGIIYKVANLSSGKYTGFIFDGCDTVTGNIVHFAVSRGEGLPVCKGVSIEGLKIYHDNDYNIYIVAAFGSSVNGILIGNDILEVSIVSELPQDSIELSVLN